MLKKKSKKRQSSHFRRLRMAAPKKRTKQETRDGTEPPTVHKKRKRAIVPSKDKDEASEPHKVRDADARMIEPHPAVIFIRDHAPLKPCGRCRECRKPPCHECSNCRNNAHLSERSHDRKRCTTLNCTRMSDVEIDRYRTIHDSDDSTAKIESDLRALRDRFMTISSKGVKSEELEDLTKTQEMLMKRLQIIDRTVKAASDEIPEGYGCLLLSIQTIETERDRIARFIDRRTTRDSPEIMRTKRQLRNYYGLMICNIVRMFATDIVARPHVERLKEIADVYEQLIHSLPICI